jgi:hypothetical protein
MSYVCGSLAKGPFQSVMILIVVVNSVVIWYYHSCEPHLVVAWCAGLG